jgi:hypothetical protein
MENADLAANANTIKFRSASARHQRLKIKFAAQGLEPNRRRRLMGL